MQRICGAICIVGSLVSVIGVIIFTHLTFELEDISEKLNGERIDLKPRIFI